jgi:hypothetical protein
VQGRRETASTVDLIRVGWSRAEERWGEESGGEEEEEEVPVVGETAEGACRRRRGGGCGMACGGE